VPGFPRFPEQVRDKQGGNDMKKGDPTGRPYIMGLGISTGLS